MDYDDLNTYNGDAEHDMWVDYTYHVNTGELDEYFGDSSTSGYTQNPPKIQHSNTTPALSPRKRLKSIHRLISSVQAKSKHTVKRVLLDSAK